MKINQDSFSKTIVNHAFFLQGAPSAEADRPFSKASLQGNQMTTPLSAETVMDVLQSSNYTEELKKDPDVITARELAARLSNECDKLNVQKTIMGLPVNERLKKYPVEYKELCDKYELKHPKPNTGLLRASQLMCGWAGLLGSLAGIMVLGSAGSIIMAPLFAGAGITGIMLDPSIQKRLYPFLEERRLQNETRSSCETKEHEMRDALENIKLVEDAALQRILHDRLDEASDEMDGINGNDGGPCIVEMPDEIEIDGISLAKKTGIPAASELKMGSPLELHCHRIP
ncbi:MAG: hypothetical protein AB2L14_06260 [Candidatus Xenobiia bacterium LiM19]